MLDGEKKGTLQEGAKKGTLQEERNRHMNNRNRTARVLVTKRGKEETRVDNRNEHFLVGKVAQNGLFPVGKNSGGKERERPFFWIFAIQIRTIPKNDPARY